MVNEFLLLQTRSYKFRCSCPVGRELGLGLELGLDTKLKFASLGLSIAHWWNYHLIKKY